MRSAVSTVASPLHADIAPIEAAELGARSPQRSLIASRMTDSFSALMIPPMPAAEA